MLSFGCRQKISFGRPLLPPLPRRRGPPLLLVGAAAAAAGLPLPLPLRDAVLRYRPRGKSTQLPVETAVVPVDLLTRIGIIV